MSAKDQADVLVIHSLRQFAAQELEKARRAGEDAQEHVLDAQGALRRAMELEARTAA
jgi:hypothetical protein